MLDARQIHPLTDFLRNHKAHVARLKESRAPEVLTVNGRAGIASAEWGESKPAEQVFSETQATYDLRG